jgi:hypothetical protein
MTKRTTSGCAVPKVQAPVVTVIEPDKRIKRESLHSQAFLSVTSYIDKLLYGLLAYRICFF